MKKTIAQTRIDEMTAKGYRYVGRTTGLYSFRKGSNLSRYLKSQGLTEANVEVLTGAHLQRGTQGWQLLVFVKA